MIDNNPGNNNQKPVQMKHTSRPRVPVRRASRSVDNENFWQVWSNLWLRKKPQIGMNTSQHDLNSMQILLK